MEKYNLHRLVQNKSVYNLPKTGKYMHYYLIKNLKPCGYTPAKITSELGTQKPGTPRALWW